MSRWPVSLRTSTVSTVSGYLAANSLKARCASSQKWQASLSTTVILAGAVDGGWLGMGPSSGAWVVLCTTSVNGVHDNPGEVR